MKTQMVKHPFLILTFPRSNEIRNKLGMISEAYKLRLCSVSEYVNTYCSCLTYALHFYYCISFMSLWAFCVSENNPHYLLFKAQLHGPHSGMMKPFIFPLHWCPRALRSQLGTGSSEITHKPFFESTYGATCPVNYMMNTALQHVL